MNPNNPFSLRCWLGLTLMMGVVLVLPLTGQTDKEIEFVTSKGMRVRLISDPEMGFVHVQLLLFYQDSERPAPAVSYLTLFHLFEEIGRFSNADLSASLRRLGNDFTVQQNPEYLYLTCNFLPDRLGTFSGMLRQLFSFQGLTLKKFSEIKAAFGTFFRKLPEWEKQLAFLTAYSSLVSGQRPNPPAIDAGQVQTANLAQVTSFYRKNFLPNRVVMVIRGQFNPYQLRGYLEKEFAAFPDRKPHLPTPLLLTATGPSRFILVDIPEMDMPQIYFFNAAPALENSSLLSFFVIHYTLFNYPFGRIFQTRQSGSFSMRNVLLTNEIISHRAFSLLCTESHAAPEDLENVFSAVEQEKRRLTQQGISRTEFANAMSFLTGKTQVTTGDFEYDTSIALNGILVRLNENILVPSVENLRRISYEQVGGLVDEYFGNNPRTSFRDRGLVVVLGNAAALAGAFRSLKPEIVRFVK